MHVKALVAVLAEVPVSMSGDVKLLMAPVDVTMLTCSVVHNGLSIGPVLPLIVAEHLLNDAVLKSARGKMPPSYGASIIHSALCKSGVEVVFVYCDGTRNVTPRVVFAIVIVN